MSAAGTAPQPKPSTKSSTRVARPAIIQQLGAEYWASLPLEMIEARLTRRDATERVYFAVIRCSLAWPLESPFAVRPTMKGGFPAWLKSLQERLREGRAIAPGELNGEMAEYDRRSGEPVPLTQEDLALITGLARSHVSTALKELRRDGLLGPGPAFYPVAKPAPVKSDPKITFEGNFKFTALLAKFNHHFGTSFTFEGNFELASKVLEARLQRSKERQTEVRKEEKLAAIEDLKGNGILIYKKERLKKEDRTPPPGENAPPPVEPVPVPDAPPAILRDGASSSSVPEPTPPTNPPFRQKEANLPNPEELSPITEAMRAYTSDTDLSGIQEIFEKCRLAEPLATAHDVALLMGRKAPGWKRSGTFIGYCLTALPKALACPGALAELRAAPPPAEAPHGALDPKAEYDALGKELENPDLPANHPNRAAFERRREELRQELRARAEKGRRR